MLKAELYFIRHGETAWNAERRLQGTTDIPLNKKGRAQALRHARVMAGIGVDWKAYEFVVSPLLRARQTFEIIRDELGIAVEARIEPRIAENSFGRWEGLTWSELLENEREAHDRFVANPWDDVPHGGESYAMVAERLRSWLQEIDRPTVAVAHGGVSRVLRRLCLGTPVDQLMKLSVSQKRFMRFRAGGVDYL